MIDMKNVINYYYGIVVNEFKKRDNNFIFHIGENEYELVQYYGDLNKVLNLYSILKMHRKQFDEIIINKNNSFITYYENIPYILLKKVNNDRNKIELSDIVNYDCPVYIKEKLNWKELWKDKLDYYEIQLEDVKLKYPLLKQSFSYYLGLSEIAINLLNYVNYDNLNYYISHKRLSTLEELFNPLNIIIDNKTRDISEFVKIKYFRDEILLDELLSLIKTNIFIKDEIILLLSRLIYPSYYFDMYEKIYTEKELEKELDKIIKKNAEYEAFLKKIYNYIKVLYNLPQIEFLEY